jgi:hypothetical protein
LVITASGMLISRPTSAPMATGGSGIFTSGIRKPIAKRLVNAPDERGLLVGKLHRQHQRHIEQSEENAGDQAKQNRAHKRPPFAEGF